MKSVHLSILMGSAHVSTLYAVFLHLHFVRKELVNFGTLLEEMQVPSGKETMIRSALDVLVSQKLVAKEGSNYVPHPDNTVHSDDGGIVLP